MAVLSDLNGRVLAEVGGNCPVKLVDQKLIDATIEFCRETLAWLIDLDPIYVVQNVQEYDLIPPDPTTRIHKITQVKLSDAELNPGVDYELLDRVTLWLNSKPGADITDGLEVEVAVTPIRSATSIDDDLLETYFDTLVAGAFFRLYRMPNKAWTNPGLAAHFDDEFRDGVVAARVDIAKNHTDMDIRTTSFSNRSFVV